MSGNSSPGDYVRVYANAETILGTLVPRSNILDEFSGKEIIVLKLDNGYNIGIEKSKIKNIEVVKKYKKEHKNNIKRINNSNLRNVLIISCGGTISSRVDYKTGGVFADYSAEDFLEMMPDLENIANIDALPLFNKMSEDFIPEDWKAIANSVFKNYDKYDGFVITQGTDTLHYSSSAISFFLRNLGKPVIFTAAQRSIDRGSSDAFMNLSCAVKAAADLDASGVFVCMHATINDDFCFVHKGTKVRKMHSLRRDAFRSINDKPIAKVHYNKSYDIEIVNDNFESRMKDDNLPGLKLDDSFEEKIAFIYFHPNLDPDIFDFYIGKKYKGFVLAGTALGHVSMSGKKSFYEKLLDLRKKKIPVVMTTQSLYGRVDPLVYSPLRKLSIECDVIFLEDMLPETAYVKLGWVLGKTKNITKIKDQMLENVSGEINTTHDIKCFLN